MYNMEEDFHETEDCEFDSSLNTSGIDIHSVECIPDIIINSFERATLPDIEDYRAFFLTKAANSIFWDMRKSEFLKCLRSSVCWKLYISEVMFGLLNLEAPWTKDFNTGSNLLLNLRNEGKIVILPKNNPVHIPLSQVSQRVTNCKSLSVTFMRHGRITQMLEFEMGKNDGTTITSCHMGTSIIEDIVASGSYTINKSRGFPKVFKQSVQLEDSDSLSNTMTNKLSFTTSESVSSMTKSFSAVLDRIRRRLRKEEMLQFKIVSYGADKLVNLWYMKHLAEEFGCGSKVHVDAEYYKFVTNYLPDFADAFSPTNLNGNCRFHFNCSSSWGLEFEEGCAPHSEAPEDFEVDFVWIGFWVDKLPKNIRIPSTSLCLPYLHEMIYDF